MKFLTLYFIFFTTLTLIESIKLNCEYESFFYFGKRCNVQNLQLISSKDDREISSIQEDENSVTNFYSNGKLIKFFPHGLTKYFNHINSIQIFNGNLEQLKNNDLQEFGDKLIELVIVNNKIEVIEVDLFIFNKNLQSINFEGNKIKKIFIGTFNALEKLNSLNLKMNSCTNDDDFGVNDREKVLKVIKNVENNRKILLEDSKILKTNFDNL